MKTATVSDLINHFSKVEKWIEKGESVRVTKQGKPFARIAPEEEKPESVTWPDFAARRKKNFGDKIFSDSQPLLDEIRAERV